MELTSSQNITYDMKTELFEQLVKQYELALFLDLLQPQPEKLILDVACGTDDFYTGCVET
ncbi:MAG: ubiquinone/menaquinone biosynthesis C-methylase UbiE [Desulforhopalus sp.]|jgi:ubiquinone/menaquinone biosynthesis C-methylase UbiE